MIWLVPRASTRILETLCVLLRGHVWDGPTYQHNPYEL